MRYSDKHLTALFIRIARVLSKQFKRRMLNIKTLPQAWAHALQQPSIQYRIAFLLTTLLALLLGWPLFVSMFPHTLFVCIG